MHFEISLFRSAMGHADLNKQFMPKVQGKFPTKVQGFSWCNVA